MTRSPKEKKGLASPNTIDVQPKTKKKVRPAGGRLFSALRGSDFGDSADSSSISLDR
jgi:hypothetical protein